MLTFVQEMCTIVSRHSGTLLFLKSKEFLGEIHANPASTNSTAQLIRGLLTERETVEDCSIRVHDT